MTNNLDYEINKELGECYLFMGELDKAEQYYQKAAGSNGVHADPYLGLATIAVQKGELKKAGTLYEKATKVEPNDKAFAGLGLIETEIGSHDRAYNLFEQALKVNPGNLIALYGLVQTAYVLNKTETAIEYLENALEIDSSQVDVRFSLAGCLQSLGRTEDARNHIEAILENEPDNEPAKELLSELS
ncbi:tetratricopeptide repeat protein [Desulfonatronovibrio magnus]|uniref:tetratricopeptide repeat protein n=1 Tax=Desulfonatronovibrio magnus TaxID=698827 RepID=UPI0005EAD22D|nr:tetratricopeptide repeat protein [Desulfonatronovibrio magnus]